MMPARNALTDDRLLDLARRGLTYTQLSAATGIARSALHRRLRLLGVRLPDLRDVRCSFCGARMEGARHTRSELHSCRDEACRRKHRRALDRERERRARHQVAA